MATRRARLSETKILQWADGYHKRTGKWPHTHTGAVSGVPGETWIKIDRCLIIGLRGLRGGTSLPRLLEKHRGVRHRQYPPPLKLDQVLGWVDAYCKLHKRWPHDGAGPIDDVPGESWRSVNDALYLGRRSFPGGSSLPKFLDRYRR